MTSQTPTWTPLRPDAPPELPGERGHVVAVVALPGIHSDGDGPDLAVELARAWAHAGRRVVLADLGLSRPSLHAPLGQGVGEGVADAVVYGSSVGRVARMVEGEPLFFISAGTAVADPGALLERSRWSALCAGFQEAGATLMAFVPWDSETREGVLRQATEVVLLGSEGEEVPALVGGPGEGVLAFLGPARAQGSGAGSDAGVLSVGALAPEEEAVASLADLAPDDDAPGTEGEPLEEEADEPVVSLADLAPEDPSEGTLEEPTEELPEERLQGPDGEEASETRVGTPGAFPPLDLGSRDSDEDVESGAVPRDPLPSEEPVPEVRPAGDALLEEGPPEPGEEGPRVPLADEILAEAGDAPEPAVQMGERARARPSGRASESSGGPRSLLLVLLLLVLVGAVLAWWFGVVDIPGLSAPGAAAASQVEPAPEPARSVPPLSAAEPVVETAPAAAWAVAVEAHESRAPAWARVAALSAAVPEQLWFTVPVEVDGTIFHRVLFGAAPRLSDAQALREAVAGRLGANGEAWLVRETPLAFSLGEEERLADARALAAEVQAAGIPAYVLAVSYSDGSERHRVYAGGFADPSEAAALRSLLEESALGGAGLVDRAGRLPE